MASSESEFSDEANFILAGLFAVTAFEGLFHRERAIVGTDFRLFLHPFLLGIISEAHAPQRDVDVSLLLL